MTTDFLNKLYDMVANVSSDDDEVDIATFILHHMNDLVYGSDAPWQVTIGLWSLQQESDYTAIDALYASVEPSRLNSQALFGLLCATWQLPNWEENMPHRKALGEYALRAMVEEEGEEEAYKCYQSVLGLPQSVR